MIVSDPAHGRKTLADQIRPSSRRPTQEIAFLRGITTRAADRYDVAPEKRKAAYFYCRDLARWSAFSDRQIEAEIRSLAAGDFSPAKQRDLDRAIADGLSDGRKQPTKRVANEVQPIDPSDLSRVSTWKLWALQRLEDTKNFEGAIGGDTGPSVIAAVADLMIQQGSVFNVTISIRQLAEEAGVSSATAARWLNNLTDVRGILDRGIDQTRSTAGEASTYSLPTGSAPKLDLGGPAAETPQALRGYGKTPVSQTQDSHPVEVDPALLKPSNDLWIGDRRGFHAFTVLVRYGTMARRELQEVLGLSKSRTLAVIAGLKAKGLVVDAGGHRVRVTGSVAADLAGFVARRAKEKLHDVQRKGFARWRREAPRLRLREPRRTRERRHWFRESWSVFPAEGKPTKTSTILVEPSKQPGLLIDLTDDSGPQLVLLG